MRGINLLEKSVLENKKEKEKKRKIIVSSVVILVSFLIFNILLFIINISGQKNLQKLNTLLETKKNEVIGLKQEEVKYTLLKQKTSFLLSNSQADKSDPSLTLSFFEQFKDIGTEIKNINIIKGKIMLTAVFSNSDSLSTAINILSESQESEKLFQSITLGGITQGKDGKYTTDINIILN